MRLAYRQRVDLVQGELRADFARAANLAFSRIHQEIQGIEGVLVPAPRAGWVECRVTVRLVGGAELNVSAVDSDAESALQRAVEQGARIARLTLRSH